LLLVCRSHIKNGIKCLHTPHIAHIGDKTFVGSCVFCHNTAEYRLFYSVPISQSHRMSIKESLMQNIASMKALVQDQ
jgi:nitrate reductase cytochrome c-type subunit